MNKELKKLTEELLNEVAIIGQPYRKNKEVYDAAFKKGLEIWEKKAAKKGLQPAGYSETYNYFKKKTVQLNYEYFKLTDLQETKVGKWTLMVGREFTNPNGLKIYYKNDSVNICLVLVKKPNGKYALRKFPYKRFLNWNSTKLK